MKRISLLRSNLFVLILSFLGLVYLAAYSFVVRAPRSDVVEIYFADRITAAHRILIDKYNRIHANEVRVIPIDFPNLDFSTNERKEILARSLRGEGDGIDLFGVDVVWVQRFAKWCEPLGNYFSARDLERIIPDGLSTCYNDGALVALPLDIAEAVFYYREDLLRGLKGGDKIIRSLEGNLTWEEFVGLRSRLRYKGPFYVFPAAEYEGMICIFVENLLSLKPDYFSTYGFNFDTPEARQALQKLVDLVQKDHAAPAVVTTFTEVPSYEYFVRNDGLFIHGWNTYSKDFRGNPFDAEKERHLRSMAVPHMAGGRPSAVFGGWNLMVSRFSKKKKEVVDFMRFLLSDESQETFYTNGGYYPVINSFYQDSLSIRRHPEVSEIKGMLLSGVHRPASKDYTNYSKIMAHYFVQAIRGTIPVDLAVKSVTRTIQSAQASVIAE